MVGDLTAQDERRFSLCPAPVRTPDEGAGFASGCGRPRRRESRHSNGRFHGAPPVGGAQHESSGNSRNAERARGVGRRGGCPCQGLYFCPADSRRGVCRYRPVCRRRRSLLAAVARPARDRRVEDSRRRPSSGARRRTSAGRSRSPAAARRRRSSGAIASSCSTAVPVGVTEARRTHAPRGGLPRAAHKYVVLAIDRKTGKTVWERVAREEAPHEASHQDNGTWASSSAVTDGEHVIASFESRGLYALRHERHAGLAEGPRRQADAQPVRRGQHAGALRQHASSSSGITQGQSFIVALDKRTGEELWRKARDEIDTWATPLIVDTQRPRAGHRARHEPDPQLRPRDRRGRLARRGH